MKRKLLLVALAVSLSASAFAQGIIHGSGDPTTLSPVPNCNPNRFYVDDSTQKLWVSSQGSPCLWTLFSASGGITNSAGANVLMKSDGTNAVTSLATDDGTTFNYTGVGGISVPGASAILGTEGVAPSAPASGKDVIFMETTNGVASINNSSVKKYLTQAKASRTANQFVTNVDATGTQNTAAIAVADLPVPSGSSGTTITLTAPFGIAHCTGACTVTIPVPALNYQFCAMSIPGTTGAITFSALGSSAMYPKTDNSAYGTAGTGTMVSGGANGDLICIVGRDATHYDLGSSHGTITVN